MSEQTAKVIIRWVSILGIVVSLLLQNRWASMILIISCALVSIGILYSKLPELSNVSKDSSKVRTLRYITIFNVIFVLVLIGVGVLLEKGFIVLSDKQSLFLLPTIFAVLIFGIGHAAPKIPYNRYTGLRLPWTVRDEETWTVAHRILGHLSLPCSVLCFAGVGVNLETSVSVSVTMLSVWILVPAVLSYVFFYKKWHRNN